SRRRWVRSCRGWISCGERPSWVFCAHVRARGLLVTLLVTTHRGQRRIAPSGTRRRGSGGGVSPPDLVPSSCSFVSFYIRVLVRGTGLRVLISGTGLRVPIWGLGNALIRGQFRSALGQFGGTRGLPGSPLGGLRLPVRPIELAQRFVMLVFLGRGLVNRVGVPPAVALTDNQLGVHLDRAQRHEVIQV